MAGMLLATAFNKIHVLIIALTYSVHTRSITTTTLQRLPMLKFQQRIDVITISGSPSTQTRRVHPDRVSLTELSCINYSLSFLEVNTETKLNTFRTRLKRKICDNLHEHFFTTCLIFLDTFNAY